MDSLVAKAGEAEAQFWPALGPKTPVPMPFGAQGTTVPPPFFVVTTPTGGRGAQSDQAKMRRAILSGMETVQQPPMERQELR